LVRVTADDFAVVLFAFDRRKDSKRFTCLLTDVDSEGGQSLPSLCTMPYEAGSCGHTHVRYYYDAGERTCKQFSYSGCLGNDNNFLNFVDCMTVCGRFSSSPSGMSTAAVPCLLHATQRSKSLQYRKHIRLLSIGRSY